MGISIPYLQKVFCAKLKEKESAATDLMIVSKKVQPLTTELIITLICRCITHLGQILLQSLVLLIKLLQTHTHTDRCATKQHTLIDALQGLANAEFDY